MVMTHITDAKVKDKGHSVHKLEWIETDEQTDGQTEAIALPLGANAVGKYKAKT